MRGQEVSRLTPNVRTLETEPTRLCTSGAHAESKVRARGQRGCVCVCVGGAVRAWSSAGRSGGRCSGRSGARRWGGRVRGCPGRVDSRGMKEAWPTPGGAESQVCDEEEVLANALWPGVPGGGTKPRRSQKSVARVGLGEGTGAGCRLSLQAIRGDEGRGWSPEPSFPCPRLK